MRAILVVALLLAVSARAADQTIPWDEADKHVGEEVTVDGRVTDVHCSPLSCLLAFEPSFNRFTAVVQARSFDVFPPEEIEQRYRGKTVRVHGTIVTRDGKPEIVLQAPDDIALGGGPRARAERPRESAPRPEGDVLDRLADALDRITALTERMAAVQERMETLLTQLEQRESALAAAESQGVPPAPAPAARPGYQSLRTIKRGMSARDVERLLGGPDWVEQGPNGYVVWHYSSGATVSIDGRGRVVGAAGVATP